MVGLAVALIGCAVGTASADPAAPEAAGANVNCACGGASGVFTHLERN